MATNIDTTFLIMSDSHGQQLLSRPPAEHIDVAIHCGDLTQESKLDEFRSTLQYLQNINADLKLVIAGNHDLTLDVPTFERLVADSREPLEPELVRKTYGDYGEVRDSLFESAKDANILLLDEGSYKFRLRNGALLRVYASPYTPSFGDVLSGSSAWGFQYDPNEGHQFDIPQNVDVVITHGPPEGILDYTASRQRAGCRHLFQAVNRARPRLHCFGHVHKGWGGLLATWKRVASELGPPHFTHIDRAKSRVLSNISMLNNERQNRDLSWFSADCEFSAQEPQTLFINAALQGGSGMDQVPWITKVPLPRV